MLSQLRCRMPVVASEMFRTFLTLSGIHSVMNLESITLPDEDHDKLVTNINVYFVLMYQKWLCFGHSKRCK
jgi:hypothetical protein